MRLKDIFLQKRLKNQIKIIKKSKLFDTLWYLKHYKDVKELGIDPIKHYVKFGWKEGRNPSPHFDTNAYLDKHPDVKKIGICPLFYYEVSREKRSASLYIKLYNKIKGLINERKKKYRGKSEGYKLIDKSKYFNAKWYLKQNPDVAKSGMDPIEHYLKHGWKEGRNPSSKFDGNAYLEMNNDVKVAKINPLLHYIKYGINERRNISFDKSNRYSKKFKKYATKLKHNKMNILLITHSFSLTGAPLAVFRTAKYLKSRGYHVTVIGMDDRELIKAYQKEKIDCFSNVSQINLDIAKGINMFDFIFANTVLVYKYIRYICHVPYIWRIAEGTDIRNNYAKIPNLIETLAKDKNVYAVSQYTQRCLSSINNQTRLLLYGIEDVSKQYKSLRESRNNVKKIRFCVIGTFCPRKAQDIILNAVSKLSIKQQKRIEIHFIGNKEEDYVKGDNLVFHGVLQGKEKYDILNACDILLCPSLDDPNPQVVMEGMMMHKPCIVSDCTGQADYIQDKENGFIVKAGDVNSLKKCLLEILRHGYDFNKMGEKSYRIYKKYFNPENYFKTVENIIEKSVSSRKTKKMLVHLHLYYQDQLNWFLKKLKNISIDYDLFVTVVKKNEEIIAKIKKFKSDAHILKVDNQGYDVYPFWQVLQLVDLNNYNYVLKLHTKAKRNFKNKWTFNGIEYKGWEWRNDLVCPLIGNKLYFKILMNKIDTNNIGMVGSKNLLRIQEFKPQIINTKSLCERMKIKYSPENFISGTMFIMKASILEKFKNTVFTSNEWNSNNRTGDGCSLAHSCETAFGILVKNCEYITVGVDTITTFYKFTKREMRKSKHKINVYKLIDKSKYFNAKWYLKQNPDVAKSGMDPIEHYLKHGWKEGRNPSSKFDGSLYLKMYNDVNTSKICPLVHYEEFGKKEKREIFESHKLFKNKIKLYNFLKCRKEIDKHKIISFDIFDTLIVRPYLSAADVFKHLEYLYGLKGFAEARINIEKKIREEGNYNGDITIDMIYSNIAEKYKILKTKEIELEYQCCQAHPFVKKLYEYALKQNKIIIISSDMYFSKRFLEKLLKKNGYDKYKKIFVSCVEAASKRDGDLFPLIVSKMNCKAKEILHIGDNPTSDGRNAKKYGIDILVLQKITDNLFCQNYRANLLCKIMKDDLGTSIFLGSLAIHNVAYKRDYSKNKYYTDLGFEYGGIVAYQFMKFVYERCMENNIKDIAMVARDGYTFQRVFEIWNNSKLNSHYVYAPRLISHLISMKYDRDNEEEVNAIANYYRKKLSIALSSTKKYTIDQNLKFLENNANQIKIFSIQKEREYKRYLKKFNWKSKKLAIIDIATIGYTAQKMFEKLYIDKDIIGFYWRINASKFDNNAFDNKGISIGILKPWDFMEFLFTAPEFPITDLDNGSPVYKNIENFYEQYRVNIYPFISEGIVNFSKDMKKYFGNIKVPYSAELTSFWIKLLNQYPRENDRKFLKNIHYASDIEHNRYVQMFRAWY